MIQDSFVSYSASFTYHSVDEPQHTRSRGMRGRAGKHAFGVAFRDQTIEGISKEDAETAFEFLTSEPNTASNALQVAESYYSSSQGSYCSVQATKDASDIAKRRKSSGDLMWMSCLGK